MDNRLKRSVEAIVTPLSVGVVTLDVTIVEHHSSNRGNVYSWSQYEVGVSPLEILDIVETPPTATPGEESETATPEDETETGETSSGVSPTSGDRLDQAEKIASIVGSIAGTIGLVLALLHCAARSKRRKGQRGLDDDDDAPPL